MEDTLVVEHKTKDIKAFLFRIFSSVRRFICLQIFSNDCVSFFSANKKYRKLQKRNSQKKPKFFTGWLFYIIQKVSYITYSHRAVATQLRELTTICNHFRLHRYMQCQHCQDVAWLERVWTRVQLFNCFNVFYHWKLHKMEVIKMNYSVKSSLIVEWRVANWKKSAVSYFVCVKSLLRIIALISPCCCRHTVASVHCQCKLAFVLVCLHGWMAGLIIGIFENEKMLVRTQMDSKRQATGKLAVDRVSQSNKNCWKLCLMLIEHRNSHQIEIL